MCFQNNPLLNLLIRSARIRTRDLLVSYTSEPIILTWLALQLLGQARASAFQGGSFWGPDAVMDVVIIDPSSSALAAQRSGEPLDECGLPLPTESLLASPNLASLR